ncbi:c-type cytochrome [Antarctobacter jejuensis]|uniref:c-type cytochrome n=1 Tax=Antarctobacter jejuensis TaxID=1439938 RepID=UPI003FD321B3
MKLKNVWIAAGLVIAVTTGGAIAESHASNPFAAGIKARKAQMQLYSFNLGILGAMAKGQTDYDAEAAMLAANNIVLTASIHQPQAWAPGSDNSAVEDTRALPALWENFADAGQKSADLLAAAEAMKAASGDGAEAIGAAMGQLGGACGACHKAYRAEAN